MDIQSLSAILSIAAMVITFLVLQPLKVQLENLTDTLQEIKSIIATSRTDMGHMSQELAVHEHDIKELRRQIEKLETRIGDLVERGCCRVDQD